MATNPFYNPHKSYLENFEEGPFGDFKEVKKIKRKKREMATFLGFKVHEPFGIPAGPLVNSAFVEAAFKKGFDICVYKTVRTRAQRSHVWPNVLHVKVGGNLTLEKAKHALLGTTSFDTPLSITNSFGVPSMHPDWWQEDMAKAVRHARKGQVLVGSFQGTRRPDSTAKDLIDDYILAAKLVKETGAHILEANLSCPNEGTKDLLCFDTERVKLIAEKIKNEIGNTPLILKLAYFKNQDHLKEYVQKVGRIVDGFSAINTIAAPVINTKGEQALPGEGRLISGVCGAAIKWAGLEMSQRLAELRTTCNLDFAIIGVGGVMNVQDYREYRLAGADAVMSATGAMWNSYLAQEIYEKKENS